MNFKAFSLVLISVISFAVTSAQTFKVGDVAPSFTLPFATKDTVISSGIHVGGPGSASLTILAFYPADWSGGCTTEMCTMRDSFTELSALGATVYGISGDYVSSHREWAKHLNLQFGLFSDHDHAVAKQYDSYNEKTGYNKRTIYVIDREGRIAYMDLAYSARSSDSFDRLKLALQGMK
ncbi:MAG: redoxin domain-containing protein [Bacteroidota bacterium]